MKKTVTFGTVYTSKTRLPTDLALIHEVIDRALTEILPDLRTQDSPRQEARRLKVTVELEE